MSVKISHAGITLENTSMRLHELALQKWLNATFDVVDGYPVPVVFSTPMDAYGEFTRLWKDDNNPFRYLLSAKDEDGNIMYEPYPAPPKYPVISVTRGGWIPRITQSYGVHTNRKGWVTTGNNPKSSDVGTAIIRNMPMAWDFRYQLDHFCLRPDTQARFVHQAMRRFQNSGGIMQSWLQVMYPLPYGPQTIRFYLDGSIEDNSELEPGEGPRIYRTTLRLIIEGYYAEIEYTEVPTFWTLVTSEGTADYNDLVKKYNINEDSTASNESMSDAGLTS